MQSFDLSVMMDHIAASQAPLAHEKGLEFLCEVDSRLPRILLGDPKRLQQILINLDGNAVKCTRAGSVAVRVSMMEKNADNLLLQFSVRDTGIISQAAEGIA